MNKSVILGSPLMKTSDVKMTESEARVQYVSNRREIPVIFEEWIDSIKGYLNAIHYPQSERSVFLMEHIDGVARRELRCEGLTWKNIWVELVEMLDQCFGQP